MAKSCSRESMVLKVNETRGGSSRPVGDVRRGRFKYQIWSDSYQLLRRGGEWLASLFGISGYGHKHPTTVPG